MNPEQHRRAGELFDRLIGLPADRQQDYIDVACGSDHELREYVTGLLAAEQQAPESFLARPAVQDAVNVIAQRAAADLPLTGTRLGVYTIGRQIGAGGMGTVYEARDTRLERIVAIKILPPALVGDPDRVRRFRHEARAVSLLNHPNIVSLFDAELEQGRCYIATEFVEGKTLRQLAGGRPIDISLLLDIAIQISSALAAAHQAGIVHRDIKPENVMVRPDGIVKVLDFGLAKLTEPVSGDHPLDASQGTATLLSMPGLIAGTLPYLSPEQVVGKPATPQCDIFSLGVLLYELATGTRPFAGPTDGAVIAAILNQAPVHPAVVRPSIGHDLGALVMRALEKDSELRYQTANDLRAALKLLARGSQPAVNSAAPPMRSFPAAARRYAGWLVAATAALVATWAWFRFLPAPQALPTQFTRLTDAPGEETYPGLSGDGNQFLYASAARGKWDIYLQRTGGSAAINLTADSPDDDTEPALSRDGARVAFCSERGGGGLFVMESTGENPTRIAPRGHLPAWSPDGKSIVYSDATFAVPSERGTLRSRLHVIDLASGAQRDLETGDAMQPSWSPHGYRIAYWGLNHASQRDIWTVGADGVKPLPVTDDLAVDWNPVWSPDGDYLYFISDRGGVMNIWRVEINERTGQTRGAPQPFTMPAPYIKYLSWSADGKRFIFSQAQHRSSLFAVEFDQTRMQTSGDPSPASLGADNVHNFSFSPDGSKIVYDTVGDPREDLWISNLNGGARRRLVSGGLNRAPGWSPTGDEIVFFSNRSGLYNVWTIHPDGSGLRQLTAVTTAGHEMQIPIWVDHGRRILASRQMGVPALLDPHPGSPAIDPPALPGFDRARGSIFFYDQLPDDTFIGTLTEDAPGIIGYSATSARLEQWSIEGTRPVRVPGVPRQFVFRRGAACYLYDLDSRREKRLFSVAPNTIYELLFDPGGRRIYFTQTIRDADLWMGQVGSSR
jgi:serine/threonine protein kinase/Tol biopolymer transport system component